MSSLEKLALRAKQINRRAHTSTIFEKNLSLFAKINKNKNIKNPIL